MAEQSHALVIDLKLNQDTRLYELFDQDQSLTQIQKTQANPQKRAKVVRDGNTVILAPGSEGSEAASAARNKLADHPTIAKLIDGE